MTTFAGSETNGMIEDALRRVYLDTNVFIQAFEGRSEDVQHLRTAFAFMQQNRNLAVTSELTLAELLAPSQTQNGRPARPNKRDFYLNLIVWNDFIDLRPVTRTILIETADLRKHARLNLPDAIHIVTAVQTRCAYFILSDRDTKRLPKEMTHLVPDPPSIRALMDSLRA